jgi:GDP-4-dehydro-6-deoxy-D-mannose reductase
VTVALVTGAYGFAGTALCTVLSEAGWKVVPVGRTPVDLSEPAAVVALLDEVRPDVVFHLAASSPQREPDPALLGPGVVEPTLGLCLALRRLGLRPRVVLAGSSAQYGAVPAEQNPVTEDAQGHPVNAYGYAKAAAEAVATALALDGAYELVPVRAFNHIGPGEPVTTVAGALATRVAAVLAGTADRVRAADLGAVRDFTDVRDIARGYLALAEHGRPGRVYNLCSGRATSVGDVLDGLLAAAGLDGSIVDIVGGGTGGIPYQVGSPARIRAETGWAPRIPLATSLADLVSWRSV